MAGYSYIRVTNLYINKSLLLNKIHIIPKIISGKRSTIFFIIINIDVLLMAMYLFLAKKNVRFDIFQLQFCFLKK